MGAVFNKDGFELINNHTFGEWAILTSYNEPC